MEGAALKPPVFTEYCTCGCRAIDHSLCFWLWKPGRGVSGSPVGACGKCDECHSFSYDGPPHESKLISLRDYNNAPTMEEAEEVREITSMLIESAGVHDHPLDFAEIAEKVHAELSAPLNFGAGIEGGLGPQEVATAQANRSGYIPGRISVEVKFPTVDMSRQLRVSNMKVHNRVLSNEEIAQRVADLVLDCLENNALAAAG